MNNLSFGEFTLDCSSRQLKRGQEVLPVNGKSFDLLVYMAKNAGRPLLKGELLSAVWPDTIVEEANLSQNVSQLRKVVGSGSDGPILTLPGRGYQFAARVTKILPEAPTLKMAPPAVAELPTPENNYSFEATRTRIVVEDDIIEQAADRRLAPMFAWLGVGTVLLAIAGWFGWQRWLDRTGGPPIQVVLIAPDGTTGDQVLDRSLTDALRMDLAQSPYVAVLSAAVMNSTLTQMMQKPDVAITPSMAREICERTNSQAVLHGSIARNGQHYLLTEDASNCVDGRILAEAKHEATRAEDLPHSIDILAESLRQKLGESRRSIARFNTPLFQDGNTVSLDALKAYSQGAEALRLGNVSKAITLFKTSVTSDPKFAAAWYGLYAAYGSDGDDVDQRAAIAEGYRLKDTASRPIQFLLTAGYVQSNTQDLYESLRNDENWAAIYPKAPQAWNQLSNVQRDLARYSDGLVSSRHAAVLLPENQAVNINLIIAELQAGDLNQARASCEEAVSKHLDGDWIRIRCLELAYVMRDPDFLGAQRAWYAAHSQAPTVTLGEARIAMAEGRFADASKLIVKMSKLFHEQGVGGAGDRFLQSLAVEMMESGETAEGRTLFRSVSVDAEEGPAVLGLVYSGDVTRAKLALHAMLTKYPRGTLWNLYWSPQIRAAIAMAEHKPKDAASILEEARPVEMRELVVPWMRGTAYLAAGRPTLAEKDFRQVITHPKVDPTSTNISLSWLGLARALAAQNNRTAATDAYRHFLSLWAHADPDASFLLQAKQELLQLEHQRPLFRLEHTTRYTPSSNCAGVMPKVPASVSRIRRPASRRPFSN